MTVCAHIGNVPVEEWLPFLVPIVALYIYGRRRERRRRARAGRLPGPEERLDDATATRVLSELATADHASISREQLPLLVPPGPDAMSAAELAPRLGCAPAEVERLLGELEALEYLELDGDGRAWLTFRGYELLDATESALLEALPHV
jgi:hypothetical protein